MEHDTETEPTEKKGVRPKYRVEVVFAEDSYISYIDVEEWVVSEGLLVLSDSEREWTVVIPIEKTLTVEVNPMVIEEH
ncbi:hypothetical protein [Ilumatobacter sp.]|uniref:hypothetical protein n=1 Tax=Ilumatobacter sp. TaxID=1967498 RepID=UPI00375344F3